MINEYWAEWITPSGNNRHNLLKDEIVQYLNIDKSNIDHLETFISPKKSHSHLQVWLVLNIHYV